MPVQMIGTRRSGSNLLRVMIGKLAGMYAPQSTHMLEYFMPLVPFYGDLNDGNNFYQLADDVCRCVELNPVEWSGVVLDRNEIIKSCKDHSLLSIFAEIYSSAAKQSDCDTDWMCKCLGYINYFSEFEEYFNQEVKYLYIHRDGRDVGLSFGKAMAGQKHLYLVAKEWQQTQELALALKQKLPADRFHQVSYEELLAEPEKICRQVAEFIGIPYTEEMLNYHKSRSAKLSASASKLWGNITKPIIVNNSKKFLAETFTDELKMFELLAGETLEKLGYERHYTQSGESIALNEQQLQEIELINQFRKNIVIENASLEDVLRRERQKEFVDSVKQRLGAEEVSYHGNMLHKQDVTSTSEAVA
ncbi:MAG: sulfotransferase [Gammaproteobacteria bacterium]|nr:sulfotransferase [Gammaproteobacteria bacterium]